MESALVCDEQLMFGQSLGLALRREGLCEVSVVTRAADVAACLADRAAHLLVISLRSDVAAALAVVRRVRRAWPQTLVVCLSTADDGEQRRAALEAGAHQVVPRTDSLEGLLAAVHGAPVPLELTPSAQEPLADGAWRLRFLTARESEVLALLVAARSTEGIARELGITQSTARSYVQSILDKLGAHSRVEAVAHVARHARAPHDRLPCCS